MDVLIHLLFPSVLGKLAEFIDPETKEDVVGGKKDGKNLINDTDGRIRNGSET